MKKNSPLEKLEELFADAEAPDVQKLEVLISETLHFFQSLREQMQSKEASAEDKEKAIQAAQALQAKLEELADRSLAATGMTRQQLQTLLSNPQNFNQEDWSSFKKAEETIAEYQDTTAKKSEAPASKKHVRKPLHPFNPGLRP